MDKFLWAVTMTDPYDLEEELHSKKPIHSLLEFEEEKQDPLSGMLAQITEMNTESLNLCQERSKMLLDIKITKPSIILKDRSYFDKSLELTMSEVTVTTRDQEETGRFHKYPDKTTITSTFVIDAKDISIAYQPSGFQVASPLSIHMEFTSLSYSPKLI